VSNRPSFSRPAAREPTSGFGERASRFERPLLGLNGSDWIVLTSKDLADLTKLGFGLRRRLEITLRMLDRRRIEVAFSRLLATGVMDQSDVSVANAASALSGRAGSTFMPSLLHISAGSTTRETWSSRSCCLALCRTGAAEVVQRIAARPPHHFTTCL